MRDDEICALSLGERFCHIAKIVCVCVCHSGPRV